MLLGSSDDGEPHTGHGAWLERMEGSCLIGAVLTDRFFTLVGSEGRPVTGRALMVRVARDLMRRFDELDDRPQDLIDVRSFFRETEPIPFPES